MVYMTKKELIDKLYWRGWLLGVGYVLVGAYVAKLVVTLPIWLGFIIVCAGYILVQWWFDRQVKKLVGQLDA